ncbi:hypothetical protein GGF32_002829 [Allomyces javanicus]|nr:hypothetical protein GGF32_002829 [Allomyces javanicus]
MSALDLGHGHREPHAAPTFAEQGPLPAPILAQAAHEQFYATVRHAVLVLVVIVAAVPVAHRLLRPPLRKRLAVRTRIRSDPVPSSLLPLRPRHGTQDDDDDALASLWMRLDADTPVVTPPDHSRASSSNSVFALPNHFDSHSDTLMPPPAPPSSRSATACTLPAPLPRSRTSVSAARPRAAGPHHLHSLWHQLVTSAWTVVAPRMFPLARARSISSTSLIDLAAAAASPPPPPAPAALRSKPPQGGLLPSLSDHGDDVTELWRTLLAPHPARAWLPTTWSLTAAMDDRLFLSRHWSIPSVLVVLCLAVLLAAPPLTIVAVALPDAAADMRLAVESLTLACAVLVLPFAYLYAEAGTPIEYELESAGAAHMMALLRPLAPLSETLSQLVPPAPISTARHVKARVIETALTLVAVYLLASLLLYVVPPTNVAVIAQVAAHVVAVTVAIPRGMALHTAAIAAWLTPRGFAAQVDAAVQVVRMQLLALPADDENDETDRVPRPRSAIAAPVTADQFFAAAAAAARSTARPTSEPDVLAAIRRPRPRTLSLDARHTIAPVSIAARRAALRAREKALRDVARVRSPARSNALFAVLATGYAAATACLAVAPWVDAGVAVRTVAATLVVAQIVTAAIASAKAPKSVAGLLGYVAVGLLAAAALPGILDTLVGGGLPLVVSKVKVEGNDPAAWPWEEWLWAGWVEMFGTTLEPTPVAVAATADADTAMPLVEYAHVACLVVLWARCAVALRRALGSTATQLRAGKTTAGGRKAREGGL